MCRGSHRAGYWSCALPSWRFLSSRAIHTLGLSCASCGYSIVGAFLQWRPGLFVSGLLAELKIRPVVRNILGARQAGTRIGAAA
jgi:hypothetical protein